MWDTESDPHLVWGLGPRLHEMVYIAQTRSEPEKLVKISKQARVV